MKDFTNHAYATILQAGQAAGYQIGAVEDWFDGRLAASKSVMVLRHDVDRKPRHALEMAKLEAAMGIRSTYYFRIVPSSFDAGIIQEIAALGHEIGYHYEDWHRANYVPEKAIVLYRKAVSEIGKYAPVRTISMHGSPMSKENNMTIWQHYSYEAEGVRDCILADKWSSFAYFTDAGRTFGSTSANLRDELGEAFCVPKVRSTQDLALYVRSGEQKHVFVSVHPERWSDDFAQWTQQWAWDFAANSAKLALKAIRQ
jgi:hypothetical protein